MAEHAYTPNTRIVRRCTPLTSGSTDRRPALLSADGERFMLILDGIVSALVFFLAGFWIVGGGQ